MANKPYIDKLKHVTKLLVKWSVKTIVLTLKKKQKALASELRSEKRPRKIIKKILNILKKSTIITNIELSTKQIMPINKIDNKADKPKRYNKIVNNPIYRK